MNTICSKTMITMKKTFHSETKAYSNEWDQSVEKVRQNLNAIKQSEENKKYIYKLLTL